MQELCGKAWRDLEYPLRRCTHRAASEAFDLISDRLLSRSLTLVTFFKCCYSVYQMMGKVFLAGI